MKYTRPTEAELPAALAKEMGWKITDKHVIGPKAGQGFFLCEQWDSDGFANGNVWNPLEDRNHAQTAVHRCAELEILHKLAEELDVIYPYIDSWQIPYIATPLQFSYAAHRALWEFNHREEA